MANDRHTDSGYYKGRTPESVGFCAGDIVGVYHPHESCVRVEVVTKTPPTIDACWREYKELLKDRENSVFYTLSYLEDLAQLKDEMGVMDEEYTLNIMPLEVPLIQYLNSKFERLAQPYKKKSKYNK